MNEQYKTIHSTLRRWILTYRLRILLQSLALGVAAFLLIHFAAQFDGFAQDSSLITICGLLAGFSLTATYVVGNKISLEKLIQRLDEKLHLPNSVATYWSLLAQHKSFSPLDQLFCLDFAKKIADSHMPRIWSRVSFLPFAAPLLMGFILMNVSVPANNLLFAGSLSTEVISQLWEAQKNLQQITDNNASDDVQVEEKLQTFLAQKPSVAQTRERLEQLLQIVSALQTKQQTAGMAAQGNAERDKHLARALSHLEIALAELGKLPESNTSDTSEDGEAGAQQEHAGISNLSQPATHTTVDERFVPTYQVPQRFATIVRLYFQGNLHTTSKDSQR